MATELSAEKTEQDGLPPKPEGIDALMARAHRGDTSCLPELRKLFKDPEKGYLVQAYGSPPSWLQTKLIEDAAGTDLAVKEASARELARHRKELAGPSPSPMEKLLAERAAICWWMVNRYEWMYANAEGLSIKQAQFHQSRIDHAHGRFLSAIRTLATVRKLALPALQVNIATNQVNTMQTEGAGR
jgi:hypothetical protein